MDDRQSSDAGDEITHESAAHALREGPRGAFALAFIAVSLLFVGWLLFYFLIFMRRGNVG